MLPQISKGSPQRLRPRRSEKVLTVFSRGRNRFLHFIFLFLQLENLHRRQTNHAAAPAEVFALQFTRSHKDGTAAEFC